ncbi:MAG: hypothetical protein GXO19_01555 [Epsilonproteobacteria bacterium]|nr:hypothetical protein [Campylobacterota bacterium]NPA56401.1 hypothetical protein [Campylobacterota bacterium]
MRFYNFLQENDRIVEAIVYKRSWSKRHLLRLDVNEFLENMHRLESNYVVGIINSEETLFYKLEFPKSLKENLKYIQIENFFISRLEESGLSSQEYLFFFKEYPHREKKGFITVYLYILPKRVVEHDLAINELYLLYDFFVELGERSSNEDLYAVVHHGYDLVTAMVFHKREMQVLNISYRNLPFDNGMLRELVQDKLGIDLKEEQIFSFQEDRFPMEYFEFIKQAKVGKQLLKLHKNYPQINIALLFPLVLQPKPIIQKEIIRHYLSPEDNRRIIYAVSSIVLIGAFVLSWGYMEYYKLSQEIQVLNNQLEEVQMKLNRSKATYNRSAISSLSYIKTLRSMPYPLFVEGMFAIEKELQKLGEELIHIQIKSDEGGSKKRSKRRKKKGESYHFWVVAAFHKKDHMGNFEEWLGEIPFFQGFDKEVIVRYGDAYIAFYKIALKRVLYAT